MSTKPLHAEDLPIRVQLSDDHRQILELGWDTEGGAGANVNLLHGGERGEIRVRDGDAWRTSDAARFSREFRDGGFDLTVTASTASPARIALPFDPRVSATTVLPSRVDNDHAFHLPAIVSSPGYGQMLVTAPDGIDLTSRLEGSRAKKRVDWMIDLPTTRRADSITLRFRPVALPMPLGMKDEARWKLIRRSWFNQFQISAHWGDEGNPFSAPAGVLSNNVISDPVSCCLFVYADAALWTPQAAPGVSLIALVSHTLDWWLDARMLPSGEVPGYWNLTEFLDANPSLIISAWDCFEATGDAQWLKDRIEKLEKAAEFLVSRDVDQDGLLEATQSGNAGSLVQPHRSCSAYDAINCGHKDAYCNALAYRAFCCLAEMEGRLGRVDQQNRYADSAARLKSAFAKQLWNPKTNLIAWWRSADGVLHDYESPIVNGLAIEYGLVDAKTAETILDRLAQRFKDSGYTRYDLGIPCTLIPVRREDYLLPNAPGLGKNADGSDTFGQYLNGGIITGDALRYLAALYTAGRADQADTILDAMLARIPKGDADAGGFAISVVDSYPRGAEFWTWDGKTCGYEGLLSHAWHFQQAVMLRDPTMRARMHRPMGTK